MNGLNKRKSSPLEKRQKRKSKRKKVTDSYSNQGQSQPESNDNAELSLQSRLKRARGTAATTPFPQKWSRRSSSALKFLSPKINHDDFESCHDECYKGFCWENPEEVSQSLHKSFSSAFRAMDRSGLFLYDVVQPGGKRSTLTSVTRCLVGKPGSTYRYLGLRLFSHPWCAVDENGDGDIKGKLLDRNTGSMKVQSRNLVELGYSMKCSKALITMGLVNQELINNTQDKLETKIAPIVPDGLYGSADFSITLINRMEPTSIKKNLKPDKVHGLGKTSVSWHKDSGLQDFSSIAVYHMIQSLENGNGDNDPWKVALRVANPDDRVTPALCVPLPSGSLYYLLDDFNHQHEHAVISGSDDLRYSSTHRVARDGSGTWQFIRDKSQTILSLDLCRSLSEGRVEVLDSYNSISKQKNLVKEVRSFQQLMTDLEFEWIRLWHIQGQHHADIHPYWHKPIENMKKWYLQLKGVCNQICNALKEASVKESLIVSEDLFDVMIEATENRSKLRVAFDQRLQDKVFSTLSNDMRPIPSGIFNDEGIPSSNELRTWRSKFMSKKNGEVPKAPSSLNGNNKMSKISSMTKKEKKKVASNWQRMQSTMKKA